jgi:DNA-binding Lrp family transcriptional regulator
MKLVMVIDEKTSTLFSDHVNRAIIRELVFRERSVSGLADIMKMKTVNVWRRVAKMKEAGIVRLSRTERVGNLEKKLYRASAMLFVPAQPLQFEPKNENLKQALAIYTGFQINLIKSMMGTEIPDDADDLVDRAIRAELESFVKTALNKETRDELEKIRELIGNT